MIDLFAKQTCLLAIQMLPYLKGNVLVQVNPFFSYSTEKICDHTRRLRTMVKEIEHDFDVSRMCMKIPSTWEGLEACRKLRSEGVKVLATTLFTMEQAAVAADSGCDYISPYINELKVHLEPG